MAKKNNIVEAKITLDSKDYEKSLSNVSKKTDKETKKIKKTNDDLANNNKKNNKNIITSNNNLAKNYGTLRASSEKDMEKIRNASKKMKEGAESSNNGIGKSNNILVKSFNALKTATENTVNKIKSSLSGAKTSSDDMANKVKKNNNETSTSFNKIKTAATDAKDTFKTASAGMSKAMSDASSSARNTSNAIKTEMDKVSNAVKKAGDSMQDLAKKTKEAGDGIKNAGDKITNSLTKPVAAAGTVATGLAVDFDYAFAKVNTLLDLNEKELADYEAKLQKTAVEMNTDLGSFADATYQAISAGVDYKEAIDFTAEAVKLAKGGFMETAGAVDTLTTILNTYGDKAGDLTGIQDKLVATQNKGKTTVAELGLALADIIPNASALSVNFNDLLGSMAHMTAGGMKTASAGTKLRAMLDELGKSGTKASDVLKEKTGKSFKELMESGKSLDEVLLIVNKGAKEAGVSLADMFGSTEAAGAANSIIGNLEGFKESVDAVKNSAGSAEKAYSKMSDTMKEKIKGAVVAIQSSMVDLGQKMEPLLDAIIEFAKKIPEMLDNIDFEAVVRPFLDLGIQMMEKLSGLIDWFSKLDKETQNFILKAVLMGATLGPVISSLGGVVNGIGSIINIAGVFTKYFGGGFVGAIKSVVSTIGGMFSGLGTLVKGVFSVMAKSVIPFVIAHLPVILAIAAVITIIVLLVKHWDTVKETVINVCEAVKTKWGEFKEWLSESTTALIEGIKAKWDEFVTSIPEKINAFVEGAKTMFSNMKENISNTWHTMTSTLSEKWSSFTAAWSENTAAIGEKIRTQFGIIKDNLFNAFNAMSQKCGEKFNEMFGKIQDIAGKIRNAVSNLVSKLKAAFNFKWSLPRIKVPEIKIAGKFSLNPISTPKFTVAWKHNGAIFTKPTVFGNVGVGDGYKGMGAQKEAVLPINKLPDLLGLNERKGGDFNLNIENFENNREMDIEQLVKEINYFARKRGMDFAIQ